MVGGDIVTLFLEVLVHAIDDDLFSHGLHGKIEKRRDFFRTAGEIGELLPRSVFAQLSAIAPIYVICLFQGSPLQPTRDMDRAEKSVNDHLLGKVAILLINK